VKWNFAMIETDQAASTAERRQFPRRRALLGAQIVFRNGNCSMGCHIVSISQSGATLRPSDVLSCPEKFTLIARFEEPRQCEVVWRKSDLLGVRF
jgi:hypothetical protein